MKEGEDGEEEEGGREDEKLEGGEGKEEQGGGNEKNIHEMVTIFLLNEVDKGS